MMKPNSNLRKAAVFIRSLDAETAAKMLAHLSPDEAAALRDAVRAVGPLDAEEQADVVAEFRSARPIAAESSGAGVELRLSSAVDSVQPAPPAAPGLIASSNKRFEFLEQAPIEALIPYLAREHAQTIALILSHLAPSRAAAAIAALPDKLQAETLERLAALGETDPDSVVVVERELAAWLARRTSCKLGDVRHNETVAAILSSTDALTRSQIIANLRNKKSDLAGQLERPLPQPHAIAMRRKRRSMELSHQAAACAERIASGAPMVTSQPSSELGTVAPRPSATLASPRRAAPPIPPFDDLVRLDSRTLAAVLREVDVELLVLALVGSQEELARRVCDQVPKRVARTLRRELRQIGPTRLSDVEEAQRAVALVAAKHVAARRSGPLHAAAT